jgi:hypothetical protein
VRRLLDFLFPTGERRLARRAWSAAHPVAASAIFAATSSAVLGLFQFLETRRILIPVLSYPILFTISFVGFHVGIKRNP